MVSKGLTGWVWAGYSGRCRPVFACPRCQTRHCEERQRRSNPCFRKRQHGLLRCARNDGERTHLRIPAAHPGFANPFAQGRGRRECRVLAAPAVPCARDGVRCAHEHTGTAGAFRHSLRNGFTAYAELSPETNSFCLRHRRNDGVGKPGRARNTSADLTPATGARTTRFCRTLQCRSSAAPPIAHRPKPALRSGSSAAGAAASTAFRAQRP